MAVVEVRVIDVLVDEGAPRLVQFGRANLRRAATQNVIARYDGLEEA